MALLDGNLIVKDDYDRYIAEFTDGDKEDKCSGERTFGLNEAQKVAEKGLAVTHPIRLGLL